MLQKLKEAARKPDEAGNQMYYSQTNSLAEKDRERNKELTGPFWLISALLTLALVAAFPPTVALGATAGWAIVIPLGSLGALYIARLMSASPESLSSRELMIAGVCATGVVAIDQWLAGGFRAPFELMFTLHILGSAAVLDRPKRLVHLAAVCIATALPLFYDTASAQAITTVVVFIVLLVLEAGFLALFADRLRAQQLMLSEAERAASMRAVTDPLTGLGNRRALAAELDEKAPTATRAKPLTIVYLDLDGFKAYNDRFGHSAGDALLERLSAALAECVAGLGRAFRVGGDEFCVLLDGGYGSEDMITAQMIGALTEHGSGFQIRPSFGVVLVPEDAIDVETALRMADQRMYADKRSGRPSTADEVSRLLMRIMVEREPGLAHDDGELGELARAVAVRLGMSAEEADVVARAAELHDIGKIAVPDDMLRKQGTLDEQEWSLMRQHTLVGERILATSSWLQTAGRLLRHSHERFDGTGYPDGLAGDRIPLGARIVAACDAYAAMLADRPYRPARSEEDALDELHRGAGTQFDPRVVNALIAERSRLRRAAAA